MMPTDEKPSRSERARARITDRSLDGRVVAVRFREGEAPEPKVLQALFGSPSNLAAASYWWHDPNELVNGFKVKYKTVKIKDFGLDAPAFERGFNALRERLGAKDALLVPIDDESVQVQIRIIDFNKICNKALGLLDQEAPKKGR